MGTFEIFNITFSTQPPVYYVGQAVAGCVNLNLKNDMEVRNIQIQMTGKALVYWKVARSETHGTGDNQTSRTVIDIYQNKKDYVEQKQHLWGLPLESGQSGWGTQTLPAGNYSMPFQLVLPHDIPFSLEGTIDGFDGSPIIEAYIRYNCKVIIATSSANFEISQAFTVANICDLNAKTNILEPMSARIVKKRSGLLRSGPLKIELTLPGKTGFVPGEKIPIQAEISNSTNVNISSWKVDLMMTLVYKAYHNGLHTREYQFVMATQNMIEEVQAGQEKRVSCKLQVPTLPPSDLHYCDFIQISYSLKFHAYGAVMPLLRPFSAIKDVTVGVPITIGNVPVRSGWDRMAATEDASNSVASAPVLDSPSQKMPPTYSDAIGLIAAEVTPHSSASAAVLDGAYSADTPQLIYSDAFKPQIENWTLYSHNPLVQALRDCCMLCAGDTSNYKRQMDPFKPMYATYSWPS